MSLAKTWQHFVKIDKKQTTNLHRLVKCDIIPLTLATKTTAQTFRTIRHNIWKKTSYDLLELKHSEQISFRCKKSVLRETERELERAENEPQRKTEDSAFFAEPNLAEYSLNKASHWFLRTPGAAVIRTLRHRQIPTYGLSWFAWKSKHCTHSQ